jgi:hypothetical protein
VEGLRRHALAGEGSYLCRRRLAEALQRRQQLSADRGHRPKWPLPLRAGRSASLCRAIPNAASRQQGHSVLLFNQPDGPWEAHCSFGCQAEPPISGTAHRLLSTLKKRKQGGIELVRNCCARPVHPPGIVERIPAPLAKSGLRASSVPPADSARCSCNDCCLVVWHTFPRFESSDPRHSCD